MQLKKKKLMMNMDCYSKIHSLYFVITAPIFPLPFIKSNNETIPYLKYI